MSVCIYIYIYIYILYIYEYSCKDIKKYIYIMCAELTGNNMCVYIYTWNMWQIDYSDDSRQLQGREG